LNGMPMRIYDLGGQQSGFTPGCDSPTFLLEIPVATLGPPVDGRFELSDDSGSIVMVASRLLAQRDLTPPQPLTSVSRGQRLVSAWTPPGAVVRTDPMIFFNPVVNEYYALTVTRAGSVIEAVVPDDVPRGPTHLQLNVSPDVPASECTGVESCWA